MAGVKFHTKINASSLLEVMVSMVILMVVFVIGMMVFLNVMNSTYSVQQLNYALEIRKEVQRTKSSKAYFDETLKKEEVTINKTVSKYQNSQDLVLLEFEVLTKENRILASYKEIILAKDGL